MHGVIDFYQAAREKGIKPIIGCEVYVAPGSRLEKKTSSGGRDVYHHLLLLAKDEAGYKNLIQLTTAAHLTGYYYKPRIDKELLAAHKDGLIAFSGCLASEIPDWIMSDQLSKAREAIDWFKQTLGADNFYLELQNHGIARTGQGQPAPDSMGEGIRPEARRDERRPLHREKPFARARLPDLHRHADAVDRHQTDDATSRSNFICARRRK